MDVCLHGRRDIFSDHLCYNGGHFGICFNGAVRLVNVKRIYRLNVHVCDSV